MTKEYDSDSEMLVAMALRARNQLRASRKLMIGNIADEFPDFWQLVQFDLNEGKKGADPDLAKALGIEVSFLNRIVKQKRPVSIRDARLVADRVLSYLRSLADVENEQAQSESDQDFSADGVPIDWKGMSATTLFRLSHFEPALNKLLPMILEIAAAKAESGLGGFGHNNPPPEQMLTPADLEEAAAAVVVVREAFQPNGPKTVGALQLSEKVFARIGKIAEWMVGVGKSAVEGYVKAAAEQAGKKTIDTIFFLKVLAAAGAAATAVAAAVAAAIHAMPI